MPCVLSSRAGSTSAISITSSTPSGVTEMALVPTRGTGMRRLKQYCSSAAATHAGERATSSAVLLPLRQARTVIAPPPPASMTSEWPEARHSQPLCSRSNVSTASSSAGTVNLSLRLSSSVRRVMPFPGGVR